MKRSQINAIMRESLAFLERMRFKLPVFAFWNGDAWRTRGEECREIVETQLGWDITDFGSGDYDRRGLFLFTLRNGTLEGLQRGDGKTYAEKILIVKEEQVTPTHFHFQKMEDIINRGGGDLLIRVWNSDAAEGLANTEVVLSVDGIRTMVPAGGLLTLTPGSSVCLPPRLYHRFWGAPGKGTILVGEVSRVNDDYVDNRFLNPVGRFADIEEDEAPLYLLYNDYARYYQPEGSTGQPKGSAT